MNEIYNYNANRQYLEYKPCKYVLDLKTQQEREDFVVCY